MGRDRGDHPGHGTVLTPLTELPMELAGLHRGVAVGRSVRRRRPPACDPIRWADLVEGAGFQEAGRGWLKRQRTLADTVDDGMRLLVCGLNPSLHAADAGVGFVSPGNRFWPAARAAGLVPADRDPGAALRAGGGMTDLVKRATPRAVEVTRAEYEHGLARVARLVDWLRPGGVCFVGLAGWRAAVDRRAEPGLQARGLGGRPVYVMPSTSGLNARVPVGELADHLRRAAAFTEGVLAPRFCS